MFCDEGVFKIILNIYTKKQDSFSNLITMLGRFHMTKCVLYCIEKVVKGSGLGNVLIETRIFSAKVMGAVLARTRYFR